MFSKYVLTFFFVYHNAAQAYICCTLGVLCQFDAQICETCKVFLSSPIACEACERTELLKTEIGLAKMDHFFLCYFGVTSL